MMFGADVCKSGTTAETCVLTAAGQKWLDDQIKDMNLAVCDGMAVSSLHLFDGRAFKGYTTPGTIQAGAVNSVDLNFPEQAIENYVSYYYNTQSADEVYYHKVIGSANETIATLTAGMNSIPTVFYTLNVEVLLANGQKKDGHAITPIAIETVSDSEKRIIVYDNNYPKQRYYITINTVANSWRYVTTATPGLGSSVYEGTGSINPIELVPLDLRDNFPFTCDFCNTSADGATVANLTAIHSAPTAQVTETVRFSYTGEGAYLVVNEDGKATGTERDTGNFIDEIPGSAVITHRGGLGLNVPPRINIPFNGPGDTFFSVFVHAATEGNVTEGDLNITGRGYSIGVNGISLDPFEEFEISVSPDGDHVSFYATEDIEAPELMIAHDPIDPGDPSVIFDIEGVVLVAGEKVMLDLDPELEQIHFRHTGPEAENFDIDMKLIWPDGSVQDWDEMIHSPAGAETAYVDFGAWDGLEHPPIYIDHVLQNPSVNHRLKLEEAIGSYDPTPQANARAGVYHVVATFQNVTEIAFTDAYFTVADLGLGNVVLNADGGPAGTGATISVPADVLGPDGILHMNESFTYSFDVGLAMAGASELTIDANGIPHDWVHPDPEPSYDANNASFIFEVDAGDLLATCGGYSVFELLDGDIVAHGFTGNIIVGTNRADTLIGSNRSDLIVGLKGHDYINGKGGNDLLCGNKGRDEIYGGNGADVIDGGVGQDRLVGGNGNDILYGGKHNDVLLGGNGRDALYGEKGHDFITGGNGNDTLEGGAGQDDLYGNRGSDDLNGGKGYDTCYGGQGNDNSVNCEMSR